MSNEFNINVVREFIENSSETTKIYIGSDSEKKMINGVWYAIYTTAIVVHHDGCRGCRIFGKIDKERDYDNRKDRPAIRLMNEVYRAAQMFHELQDSIGDREFEIHLDLNPDEHAGSNCVMQQAIGYIRGTCNVVPMVKPDAFAASYAADRLQEVLNFSSKMSVKSDTWEKFRTHKPKNKPPRRKRA